MSKRDSFDEVWKTLPQRDQIPTFAAMDTISLTRVDASPVLELDEDLPGVGHLVELGAPLGAGGNGEVFEATQEPLVRVIAVKRPIGNGSGNTQRLLQEARVIGFLEHPGIPPVHFVGGGNEGELLVGLKRIEGETLREKLQRDGQGQLDENLDILIQICNAVGFAHANGVVHQDLKPDNVMTGQFGEVYVLDWGLALAVRDDVPQGIPRPEDEEGLRGTAGFIAPETVIEDPPSPATDVYQLGGILHVMLTGQPPNAGETAMDALLSAYEPPAKREFPPDTPPALADICRRALAPEPRDRYPDAHALHESLLEFRRRRGELEAVKNAAIALETLKTAIDGGSESNVVYQRYGAARGAAEALAQFGSSTAKPLHDVLAEIVAWELDRKNLGGAELLLSEMSSPDPMLIQARDILRAEHVEERNELKQLRQDADPSIDVRGKSFFMMAIGVMIGILQLVPHVMGIVPTPESALVAYLVYMAFLVVASVVFYRQMTRTRINHAAMLAVWQLSFFGLICRVGGYLGIMPLYAVVGYDLVAVTLTNVFFAAVLDRRIYASAPIYAVGAVACFTQPENPMLVFGLTHFVGLNALGIAMMFGGRLGNRLSEES